MEQEETTVCPVCGGSNIYESGDYLGCADCRSLGEEGATMNELDNYPRPWRVTKTSKRWKTGGGYNYHIRAANGNYVAERLMGGISVATAIVEGVNERDERDRLRAELAERNDAVWQDDGTCPLCAAPGTRISGDAAHNVRVSYCFACQTAILWTSLEARAAQAANYLDTTFNALEAAYRAIAGHHDELQAEIVLMLDKVEDLRKAAQP